MAPRDPLGRNGPALEHFLSYDETQEHPHLPQPAWTPQHSQTLLQQIHQMLLQPATAPPVLQPGELFASKSIGVSNQVGNEGHSKMRVQADIVPGRESDQVHDNDDSDIEFIGEVIKPREEKQNDEEEEYSEDDECQYVGTFKRSDSSDDNSECGGEEESLSDSSIYDCDLTDDQDGKNVSAGDAAVVEDEIDSPPSVGCINFMGYMAQNEE